MPKIKVTAVNMLPGDILCGSKETVVNVYTGIKTPSGYVNVHLSNERNGILRGAVWRRNTMINVERGK